MALSYAVFDDGSFSIEWGSGALVACYPGIDGLPLRPRSIAVTRSESCAQIRYALDRGALVLSLRADENGSVTVGCELRNFSAQPLWVHPLMNAQMRNADFIYRMGLGTGGPSGVVRRSAAMASAAEPVESYGMAAIGAASSNILIYSREHDRFLMTLRFYASPVSGDQWLAAAGFRTERAKSGNVVLPDLHFSVHDSLDEGLKTAARDIAAACGVRLDKPPAYHWCSWYYAYYQFDHQQLSENLQYFASLDPPVPLRYIQIDAGYCRHVGDWLDFNERWPKGMQAAFDEIRRHGFLPGIWIGPYMAGCRSRLALEHPDWLLRDNGGKPVNPWNWRMYNENKLWGLQDEEYYMLDTSHPAAMEYLRTVFRTFRRWGAEIFKTDFMVWGMQDSSVVRRHAPGKTCVEYMRDMLDMIREEIGSAYWLGCIAPFWPCIGYVDAMRIAGDVGVEWKGGFGPENMLREIPGVNHINGAFWQNDPDAVMLRDFHSHLTDAEVESLALIQAVSGGALYTSDPLHRLRSDRRELFRFIRPEGGDVQPAFFPFLGREKPHLVMVQKLSGARMLVLIFNPADYEIMQSYRVVDLCGRETMYFRQWKTDKSARQLDTLAVNLPAHGSALYFASEQDFSGKKLENLWRW